MGKNVRHFTTEQKDENTYGWPWNEVVKSIWRMDIQATRKNARLRSAKKSTKFSKGMRSRYSMMLMETRCLM